MKLSVMRSALGLPPGDREELEITDVVYDSRKVVPGCLFVCLRGAAADGHRYAAAAVEAGAVAVLAEEPVDVPVPVLLTGDTRKGLALASAAFFGHPAANDIEVIAVTGTKGKTTTACMIRAILEAAGEKTGVIGTMGVQIGDETIPMNNTTPASYEIQKYLRRMVSAGCRYCVMEASSIGLREDRVYGFPIKIGVYTNFSEDHIGGVEHRDMAEYLACKQLLFRRCETGVINVDDESWQEMVKGHTCTLHSYGFEGAADVRGEHYEMLSDAGFVGIQFDVSGALHFHAEVGVPGRFNASNALGAIACCHLLGVLPAAMNEGLRKVKVKGRMEPVPVPDPYTLLIDYAHNAVSMESLLKTLRAYEPNRLICMFGAGGNRPKVRRYEMGEVCGRLADLSVITEDNSRDERVEDIIEDILIGMKKTTGRYAVVPNRKAAIKYCMTHAQPGDIVVLAGKGHEDYQEIKGVKHHLDEREVIAEVLEQAKADSR